MGDVLGNYEYLDNDVPLQVFDVQESNPKSYNHIELIIKSNHGNQEYTCLYRFRVHGQTSVTAIITNGGLWKENLINENRPFNQIDQRQERSSTVTRQI